MINPKDNETVDAAVVTGKPTGPKTLLEPDSDATLTDTSLQEESLPDDAAEPA